MWLLRRLNCLLLFEVVRVILMDLGGVYMAVAHFSWVDEGECLLGQC